MKAIVIIIITAVKWTVLLKKVIWKIIKIIKVAVLQLKKELMIEWEIKVIIWKFLNNCNLMIMKVALTEVV